MPVKSRKEAILDDIDLQMYEIFKKMHADRGGFCFLEYYEK